MPIRGSGNAGSVIDCRYFLCMFDHNSFVSRDIKGHLSLIITSGRTNIDEKYTIRNVTNLFVDFIGLIQVYRKSDLMPAGICEESRSTS